MKTIFKTTLIIINNRQYNLLDVALFCAFAILIAQSHYAIAVYTLIVGSILNALVSLKVSKL